MLHMKPMTLFCLTLAVSVVGVLAACDGPTNTPPPPGVDVDDPADADAPDPVESTGPYRLNLEGVGFPDTPAQGRVGDQPFVIHQAVYSIESGSLRLTSKQGQEVFIFVLLNDQARPQGESVTVDTPSYTAGDANIHVAYLDNETPVTQMVTTGFVLKLEFDDQLIAAPEPEAQSDTDADDEATATQPADTAPLVLPGRVYLCLPDAYKSYVAGTFHATVVP